MDDMIGLIDTFEYEVLTKLDLILEDIEELKKLMGVNQVKSNIMRSDND